MARGESSVGYMVQLDGIRAFAVGGVILEHWASGFPARIRDAVRSVDLGGLGVECFFVLSGFLITLILLATKDEKRSFKASLGHFYVRRALRIFPAYYVALLATSLLFAEMRGVAGWHALYLSNIYPAWYGNWPPIGGHFWSLSVEEQFYLFWPLIVLGLPIRVLKHVALACCLLAPLSRLLLWHLMGGAHIAIWTLTTGAMDLLCFGAFLACLKYEGCLSAGSRVLCRLAMAGLIALLLYVVIYAAYKDTAVHAVLGRTATALFFGALVAHAANGLVGPAGRLLENRTMVWLGMISYGLYIFHPFVPRAYALVVDSLGLDRGVSGISYVRFPLLILLLLLVTSASFYLVERPIRRLKRFFP